MNTEIAPEVLVNKICLQWIQERREGRIVSLGDYLERYPVLRQPDYLLDLIDADFCVCQERGESIDVNAYTSQFPELANQIRLLVELESFDRVPNIGTVHDRETMASNYSSDSFSRSMPHLSAAFPVASIQAANVPVTVPDFFIANEVVLASPGHWLVRGRHGTNGQPLGLKVVSLDKNLSQECLSEVLDVCEAASRVQHPVWTAPQMAFIENSYLGVVRPWVFAVPESHSRESVQEKVFKKIGLIAMTLQAAHDSGATHGCVGESNVVTDHAGQVWLLDGAASSYGWRRSWQSTGAVETRLANFETRRLEDVRGLLRWIATIWINNDLHHSLPLLSRLQQIAAENEQQACATIADFVFQFVHQDPGSPVAPARRWWKRSGLHS